MLGKRILSGMTALAIAASIFAMPVFAKALPDSNVSNGMFELKQSDDAADYYELNEEKSGGNNVKLTFNMKSMVESRKNIVDYKNPDGEVAKFAHTRFLISTQKGPNSLDTVLNELRILHCIGSNDIIRFNIDANTKISIYDGADKTRGMNKEYTWKVSTTDEPFYNQVDLIEDCKKGVIYLFINGRLNAYSLDGSTDGKFYGYIISKNENDWDESDVLTVGFDETRQGHTIYNDGNGYTVTMEDVISDIGIEDAAYTKYQSEIDKNANYVLSGGMYVHRQTEPVMVTGTGRCIQFEEGSYTSDYALSTDRNAADVKALKCKSSTSASSIADSEQPSIDLTFTVDEKATYTIWMRYYAPDKRSDSFFWAFGEKGKAGSYKQQDLDEEAYKWMKMYSGKMYPDKVYEFKAHYREPDNELDCLLVTRVPGFSPTGRYGDMPEELQSTVDPLDPNRYNDPPITPPAHTHPRVMFTEKDIPRIKANMASPMNAAIMEEYNYLINKEQVDLESSSYSISQMMQLECCALEYALNGDVERGMRAKEGIMAKMENLTFDPSSIESGTRTAGYAISQAARIYDWCYDLFTAKEREKLILNCIMISSTFEMVWPPTSQGVLTSHGAEAQLLRDYLTLAIAVYDERPDFWDFIGGRYYQQYVPIRQTFNTVLYQGSDYGIYRQLWNSASYSLIKGMGYDFPIDTEKYYNDSMWSIYYRRPDGQIIRNGDISHGDKTAMWEYWRVYTMNWLDDAYISNNPYSKLEFARQTSDMSAWIDNGQNYTSLTDEIIMNDAELEPARSFDTLPYSKYFGTPNGVMVARTGWEDGADAPTVVAEMKVQEYQINGHMHLDAGHFQIYYKGQLATDSGVYQGLVNSTVGDGATAFGSVHYNQYQSKTVAHNCMLVMDPSEGSGATGRGVINDGGQKAVRNGNEAGGSGVIEDEAHVAEVQGMEIDPKNPDKPLYSYLKGDLTNAYSKKVTDYKRSFMFLNLDNEAVPAALIVFDKIDSSNASYKKAWLLHGLEEPEIKGNQTIFRRTYKSPVRPHGYNGKLTVDTLLPAKNNIAKVGGDEMGWSNAGGKDYYGQPFKSQTDEGQTWRIEISPQGASAGDYFLNVMQVSDNDKENYLPVAMVENNLFYGATISDRVVTFSKSAKRVSEDFTLKVDGNGDLRYTLCDIAAGRYTVSAGGKNIVCEATEEGGVLSFTAPAGTISVKKTDGAEITEQENRPISVPQKDSNAVSVLVDNVFVYQTVPAVLKYDTIMVTAYYIQKELQVKMSKGDNTITFEHRGNTITMENGSTTSIVNGEPKEMSAPAVIENDVWFVPVRAAVEALGGSIEWRKWANTVAITSPTPDLSLPDKGYVRIVNAIHDGGDIDKDNTVDKIFDEDPATIWSTNGETRYVTLELEKASTVNGVDIMFNPNSGRDARFTIAVSRDGKQFTDIMKDHGDGSVEGGAWETFMFEPQSDIKYVRYYGNGSSISRWNAVKEIRIRVQ